MNTELFPIGYQPSPAERLYFLLKALPSGHVLTYGQAAKLAGITSPRQVGRLLHVTANIPCHRVVNARGKLAEHFALGGREGQAERLMADGIPTDGYRVNLKTHRLPVEIKEG